MRSEKHCRLSGRTFLVLLSVTLLLVLSMNLINAHLQTTAAPGGIVTLEFAGDLATVKTILHSWQDDMFFAGLSLGLDFLFLLAYSITIAVGCLLLADRLEKRQSLAARIGRWLAGGQLLAAGLDTIENLALVRLLAGSEAAFLPRLAAWCAAPKFLLVGLGLAYLLAAVLLLQLRRKHPVAA
ncbi:MAG: hypothetical protein ABIA75_12130 [Candidatus Neomarinimicrobiota bacterium]